MSAVVIRGATISITRGGPPGPPGPPGPIGPEGPQGPIDTTATTAIAVNGKGFVNHGNIADTARPAGFASIEWSGSVEPTNAIDDDTWIIE